MVKEMSAAQIADLEEDGVKVTRKKPVRPALPDMQQRRESKQQVAVEVKQRQADANAAKANLAAINNVTEAVTTQSEATARMAAEFTQSQAAVIEMLKTVLSTPVAPDKKPPAYMLKIHRGKNLLVDRLELIPSENP